MKILILSAFLVAGAIVQPAGAMAQSPSSTPAGPTIKFVAEQGYSLAVFGSHWTPGRRLVLSVHQPAMSAEYSYEATVSAPSSWASTT